MSYNISKELFEKVMNVKLTTDLSIAPYYNEVNGCEEEDLILINYNFIWIPLDTFFFKCKEWAYNQGYDLYSDTNGADVCYIGSNYSCAPFHYRSEQQAVFDACEYILNKLSNKE